MIQVFLSGTAGAAAGLGSAPPSPGAFPRHPRPVQVPAANNRTPAARRVSARRQRLPPRRVAASSARSTAGHEPAPCPPRSLPGRSPPLLELGEGRVPFGRRGEGAHLAALP